MGNVVHQLEEAVLVGQDLRRENEKQFLSNVKLQSDILDTARSIEVIGSDEFRAKGALSLQDTLSYSAGVFAGPFGNDTRIDTSTVRGITPLSYQDGFQSHIGFYNTTRTDIYTLESVEVIKGP